MKYSIIKTGLLLAFAAVQLAASAQDEEKKRGFKKENLFTGGSVSLSFGNNTFLAGVNPVFGYSLTNWADAGVVVNYIYASQRGQFNNDKLRQTLYGGGVFTRLFPVRFLFAQVQVEHNFINYKYIYENGSPAFKDNVSATSTLIGGGYATGRQGGSGRPFAYLAVLFDIGDDEFSPYKDELNRSTPIIRAGFHVPLFQGSRNRNE